MEKKASSFSGQIGFVLAAAGSAVGVGNLWRFPYLAAKDGGGLFLLPFIIQPIEFSNLHQKRQNLPIPACELRHHLPKRFGKSLAFFAFGRYASP